MTTTNEDTFLYWLRHRPAGSLSPQEVAHFIRQAANALQLLHNRREVHGQVSPASFLVRPGTAYPGLPNLQLADFGMNQSLEVSGIVRTASSSPDAMAPEQWSGETIPASDQYALAVMAYQLLTWRSPFQGSQEQLRYQHLHEQPQLPSSLNTRIPPTLDSVIQRALAKNPADRYPSITVFAEAFQQALQPQQLSQPFSPPRPSELASPAYMPGVVRAMDSTPAIAANVAPTPAATPTNHPTRSSRRESLILTLAFLVVVSGIGFGFYSIVKNNQTSLNNVNATATPIARTIPLAPTFTNNTLIFSDPLTSNTNGHWDNTTTCMFRDASYHVLVLNASDSIKLCGLLGITFANVAVQVDVSILSGNDAGLFFRYNNGQWYNFEIDQHGDFILLRYDSPVNSKALFPLTKSNAIAIGSHKNTLLVIVNGTDMKLYINGMFVGEAHDNTYTNGLLGFVAGTSNLQTTGDASFSNLKVFKV